MLKIYNLCDNNSVSPEFRSEHGLSYYIETFGQKILFDAGQSDVFLENAEKLKLNLKDVDFVVLSHGHYDHTGGLAKISGKQVYCHQEIFTPKYKLMDNQYKFIGSPLTQKEYEGNNKLHFNFIDKDIQISKNIYLLTGFKKASSEFYFFIKKEDKFKPDKFLDEVALAINTSRGIVIFTGCAHSGIINIVEKAWLYFDRKNIYGLFGGFHLSKLAEPELLKIATKLEEYNINKLGLSHCTGDKFINCLHGNEIFNFSTGQMLKL